MRTFLQSGIIRRPRQGPCLWAPDDPRGEWLPTGEVGWQSNGGSSRVHPDRSLPLSFEVSHDPVAGVVSRLHLVGIFALHAGPADETPKTIGAQLICHQPGLQPIRISLFNGRHYRDASVPSTEPLMPGDGSRLDRVGTTEWEDQNFEVSRLTIDFPPDTRISSVQFSDLGTPASFVLFDVFFEVVPEQSCPFSSRTPGVSLADVGTAVRVGDRVQITKSLSQLEASLSRVGHNLDEARGSALLFLAVVSAAKLESGTRRPLHRFQLDAARALEAADSIPMIIDATHSLAKDLLGELLEASAPTDGLINRAISIVDRAYGKKLSDIEVSKQLGLSTSHFRFLFREATGQPFHQYLISMRLEKARALLMERDLTVGEVAGLVGFHSAAHFSRVFQRRFKVPPSQVRSANR